jgi:thiol-disulfide isomerase/thioredoxin
MPRFLRLSLSFLVLAVVVHQARGETPHYVLGPITTEVQKRSIASDASVVCKMNAQICIGLLKTDEVKLDPFVKDMQTIQAKHPGRILVDIQFGPDSRSLESDFDWFASWVKTEALTAGFESCRISKVSTSSEWKELVDGIDQTVLENNETEPILLREGIEVYPIRNQITRCFLGKADCVVKIAQTFDGRQSDLTPSQRRSITEAIVSLQLTRKEFLQFSIQTTAAGSNVVDTLFRSALPPTIAPNTPKGLIPILEEEIKNFKLSPAMAFARSLGFERIGVRVSPNGGAPETLIGTPAPAFELVDLSGSIRSLDELRAGKPALVSFWGVACGPCQLEAPHLTRLHKEFGDRFAIISINAYDESSETVQKFVDREKLEHTVLLMGGALSTDRYKVRSHPTTFWLDSKGIVYDYVIGFDRAEEIESRIRKSLAEPPR